MVGIWLTIGEETHKRTPLLLFRQGFNSGPSLRREVKPALRVCVLCASCDINSNTLSSRTPILLLLVVLPLSLLPPLLQVESANIGKAAPKPDFLDEEAEQGDGRLKAEGEAQSGESGDEVRWRAMITILACTEMLMVFFGSFQVRG